MKVRRPGRLAPFGFIRLGITIGIGAPPVADSLQISYDGGRTIDESVVGEPIQISNGAAAVAALMEMTATANALAIAIVQNGQREGIEVTMDPTAVGYAGLNVETTSLNQLLVSLHQSVNDVQTYLYGGGLLFGSGADAALLPTVIIATGETAPPTTSPALQLKTGRGANGSDCGSIDMGFDVAGNVDGGMYMNAATGRTTLRLHQLSEGGEGDTTDAGTLRLHNMDGEQEQENLTPQEGDLHLRTTQDVGGSDPGIRSKGFRAYRAAAYALVGRGYQRPFSNSDLTGGGDNPSTLNVTHSLDTPAPLACLYDGDGTLVPPGPDTWTAYFPTDQDYTVELNASLLPISGTWTLTLMGF